MSTTDVKAEISTKSGEALTALKKYVEKDAKKYLFPEADTGLSVVVSYKRVSLRQPHYRKLIQLPHPERTSENTSICLILPDLGISAATNPDVDEEARKWAEIIRTRHSSIDMKKISKIFTFTQLKREYSDVVDKKKLANTYDIFLVEAKLFKKTLCFLGKYFTTSAKKPLAVHARKSSFPREVERVYSVIGIPLDAMKDAITVRVGNLGQPAAHLRANVDAFVDKLTENCAGGAANIRSVYLKAVKVDLPLPVFIDFGSPNEIEFPSDEKDRLPLEIIDECSTLPDGLVVKVLANGEVTVIDEQTKEQVVYPTLDDEWEARDDIKPRSVAAEARRIRLEALQKSGGASATTAKTLRKEEGREKRKRKLAAKLEIKTEEEAKVTKQKEIASSEEATKKKRKRKA